MRENTPPHEDQYESYDIGEADEVYEINDEDDLNFLDEDNAGNDENDEMDELNEEEEDGDEGRANPIVFSSHQGSVFCCALSPKDDIGASGGEDDKAYVWDASTGNTLFECTGHKDSVTNLGFNHDGNYLATADMSGYIQAWKIATKTRVWEFETNDLNWIMWHRCSNILLAGTSSGHIWVWLVPKSDTKSISHSGVSSECSALARDGKRLCCGFADGTVSIVDLKSSQTLQRINCHSLHVTSVAFHKDNTLALSGSTDGTAKLLNSVTGKVLATFNCDITETSSNENEASSNDDKYDHSVEVVSFCPMIPNLAVTATLSGMLTIWDISSQTSRHHIVQGCGSSSIIWHPKEPYFLTSGLDGILRVFDVRSAEQILIFKGHRLSILCSDIKKDGSKIVTASDDDTVRILNTESLWSQ